MRAYLWRIKELSDDKQTIGRLKLYDNSHSLIFDCYTLELPFRDNMKNASCILSGCYVVDKQNSPKFGVDTFTVNDVHQRKYIRIHEANYVEQLKGCIAVGEKLEDLNGDGLKDVTNSVKTLNNLKSLTDRFYLSIFYISKESNIEIKAI